MWRAGEEKPSAAVRQREPVHGSSAFLFCSCPIHALSRLDAAPTLGRALCSTQASRSLIHLWKFFMSIPDTSSSLGICIGDATALRFVMMKRGKWEPFVLAALSLFSERRFQAHSSLSLDQIWNQPFSKDPWFLLVRSDSFV